MKKTLITILAMTGVATAAVSDGYLTNPDALTWETINTLTTTSVTSSNAGLEWISAANVGLTKSWEVTFTLSVKTVNGDSDELFGTNNTSGANGWVLNVGSNGQLFLGTNDSGKSSVADALIATDTNLVSIGKQMEVERTDGPTTQTTYGDGVVVTLQFMKYVNQETNHDAGGRFSLTVGEGDAAKTYSADTDINDNLVLYENNQARFWTNGTAQKMENISLREGGIMYIPEPGTAALSLLALAGLATRRRRQ